MPFYKGQKFTEEHKRKISEWHKGKSVWVGRKHSEETKQKNREAHLGEKSHLWQGGVWNNPYPANWNNSLREIIRKRDGYTCKNCGVNQDKLEGRKRKLEVHHIDYNKNNLDLENLITLCHKCHLLTNLNRDYWKTYFTNGEK